MPPLDSRRRTSPFTASWRETHHARHLPRLYDTQRRPQLDVGMVTRNVIIINTAHYTDTAVYMEVPNGVLDPKVHVYGCETKMSLPLRNDFWTGKESSLNHIPWPSQIHRRKQGHGIRHSKAAYLLLLW